MKIFVSAAEISSDIHAAAILQGLIEKAKRSGEPIQIVGIGGPCVRKLPHFECIEMAENLRAMGIGEVLGKIFFIRSTLKKLVQRFETFKPDLLLTFDYPDFHLRFLKALNKRNHDSDEYQKVLKICAIPPKIWVWRASRIHQIRELYDAVLVVFPFERHLYEKNGIPVLYAGNPLAAQLPFQLSQVNAIERLGAERWIRQGYYPVAVLPGSREGELKYHLPVIKKTLELYSTMVSQKVLALVPLAPGSNLKKVREHLVDSDQVKYCVVEGFSETCLKAAHVGLIKSGTSTLEAVLLGVFPVIFYKMNFLSEWVFRLFIRYVGPVGLPNILLGIKKRSECIFPEWLGPQATPENLAKSLIDAQQKDALPSALALRKMLVPSGDLTGTQTTREIADQLLLWCKKKPFKRSPAPHSLAVGALSWGWSVLNLLRRKFIFQFGKLPSLPLSPSVLIGNLQAGGSGKTPVLKALARHAIHHGLRVAILTRGYKGTPSDKPRLIKPHQVPVSAKHYGDEVAELQEALPEAVIGVGPDRILSAQCVSDWAEKSEMKIDLCFLDDGFQNLKFKADYQILCVTDLLPSQTVYRDFKSQAHHADLIIGTKGLDLEYFECFAPRFARVHWLTENLPRLPIHLLTALGDPREVEDYYRQQGVTILHSIRLGDHAPFETAAVKKLIEEAAEEGALLAVTQKDFMKLRELGFQVYKGPLSELEQPKANQIAVLRREADVKELFKRILKR